MLCVETKITVNNKQTTESRIRSFTLINTNDSASTQGIKIMASILVVPRKILAIEMISASIIAEKTTENKGERLL